jgi:hypothetical protein
MISTVLESTHHYETDSIQNENMCCNNIELFHYHYFQPYSQLEIHHNMGILQSKYLQKMVHSYLH